MNRYPIELDALPHRAAACRDAYEVMMYQLQYDDDLIDEALDALVAQVASPIIATIDCTQCGNCCRSLDVYLEPQDIARLAQGVHIPPEEIVTRYVCDDVLPESGAVGRFTQRPCSFLEGGRCSVYEHRPQACREYPFLTPDFRWSMEQLIPGAAICPIIFYTLNAMLQHVDAITAGQVALSDDPPTALRDEHQGADELEC